MGRLVMWIGLTIPVTVLLNALDLQPRAGMSIHSSRRRSAPRLDSYGGFVNPLCWILAFGLLTMVGCGTQAPASHRSDVGQRFVDQWTHPSYRASPVAASDLQLVEDSLSIQLPAPFRHFLISHGPVAARIGLLDTIVDLELDVDDLNEFHSPDEIVSETLAWREMGLPAGHIAFARDSMGNLFCFNCPLPAPQCTDEIWVFDHETGDLESTGLGFVDWLEVYASLPSE